VIIPRETRVSSGLMGVLLIGAGVALSVVFFFVARGWERQRIRAEFTRDATDRVAALTREIEEHILVLECLGGLFDASNQVERDEFQTFAGPLLLTYPGLQALEWIPRVPDSQREVLERAARQDGLVDFTFTERQAGGELVSAARRREHFPVYYVEPYAGNERAAGFDLASESARLEALQRSRDTGGMVATAPLVLVQEKDRQFGFLVCRPVYRHNAPLGSVAERRENLVGLVVNVAQVGPLVEHTFSFLRPKGIDVRLYDLAAPEGQRLLYTHWSRTRPASHSPTAEGEKLQLGHLQVSTTLDLAGREWSVLCTPTSDYVVARTTRTPATTLIGGLLLTGLLAGYLRMNAAHAKRVVKINRQLASELAERKRVELERAEAHWIAAAEASKLRAMIEGMDEGVVVADSDDIITEVNTWFLSKTGLKRDAVVGKSLWDFHPNTAGTARLRAILGEFRSGRRREGHTVDRELLGMQLSLRVQPIFDQNAYRGIILNVIDVTNLVSARQAAEAANHAKSEFLANMSHEIRTPMAAILGYTELMIEETLCCTECPEHASCTTRTVGRERVAGVRSNGELLLSIVNDILDLSKIEAGKMVVERVRCSPCQLVAEVASAARVRAQAKGVTLKVEYAGPVPDTIHTDPTRLRQILVNLIGNAVKFTDVGMVRIVTRFLDDPAEPRLEFEIIDTGVGMTDDQVATLFQPFTQADTSTTRRFGGTGLGLTISRRLAELLGGEITIVETRPGAGTRLRVTVPTGPLEGVKMIADPLAATVVKPSETRATAHTGLPTLCGCRILLAEDGPDNQRLIAYVLKKAGAQVSIVENGQLATQAALAARDERQPFDLILMDMQMPVMDGYKATNALRQNGYTGPIVALTAHAMADDRQKCINAGCDDYVTKPIDRKTLITTVSRLAKSLAPASRGGAQPAPAHDDCTT
jgi:PAS domain S-box-containing protein